MSGNQDIKKINKSLEEADKGFLLSFPPPSGIIKKQDLYKYDFDVAYRLPLNPLATVAFTPSSPGDTAKASYLSSSINASINVGVSIKSIHKSETQSLIRLNIKDIYNNILYTDYILVICSPQQRISLRGEILPRIGGNRESIGPNGGRVLRIDTINNTSDAISQLLRRMRVEGPGIPVDQTVTISTFIEDSRSDIELLPYFEIANEFNSNFSARGSYVFTITTSCTSEEDLREIAFNNQFVILDKTNNWSFSFRDRKVLQFIRNTGITDEDISVLLDIKNFDALLGNNSPSSIPIASYLYGGGRVVGDSICLKSI